MGLPDAQKAPSTTPVDSTVDLLDRIRAGDDAAREQLFARCLPVLQRWARGRLPHSARDLADTADLVQEAAISTLKHLHDFRPEHPGAFTAYLREAVANRIRDYLRSARRRPVSVPVEQVPPDNGASPLALAIGQQQLSRYESALGRLNDLDRAAIVARLELQYSYAEVASALGKPTANAARVAVVRAIERLVTEMDRGR